MLYNISMKNSVRLSMINDYEVMINYFIKHRWEKYGYLSYRVYALRIKTELDNSHDNPDYRARLVFNSLKTLGFIEKVNIHNRYIYRFNNPEHELQRKNIVLNFD